MHPVFESTMRAGRRRIARGFAVAVLVHAPLLVALAASRPPRPPGSPGSPGASSPGAVAAAVAIETPAAAVARRAAARAERERVLATAEADLLAGRVTFGETLIRLGWADRAEEDAAPPDPADRERALAAYHAMLADVRAAVAAGEAVPSAIAAAARREGRASRYKRMHARLADALARGGGNCVAQSTLATALAVDVGSGERAAFRVYQNHVTPDVDGFRFGMAGKCHGQGVKVEARQLLSAYAKARAARSREPFLLPEAADPCDDPGDVFAAVQLRADDAPPLPPLAPHERASAAARPPAPAEEECRRRTVFEEYDDDVEAIGPDGVSLGGVGVPRLATLDLAGHARSAACFERRLEALDAEMASATPEPNDADALVLMLGDAALAAEDSARVFAAAGEIDVAREYEVRLAAFRQRAATPLERVIARMEDPASDMKAVVSGAGRLVALGEGGRTVMLLASERHRGYWELANLMTRPQSQAGAIARWGKSEPSLQRDVVTALPCASETFRAQLAAVGTADASRIAAACDARTHAMAMLAPRRALPGGGPLGMTEP